jgi:hypothetical protein
VAGGFTTYVLEQQIQGTLYAALFTASPGPGGGGTEASYAGYARVAHAAWVTEVDPDGLWSERRNNGAIEWPAVPEKVVAGWWGLFDAATLGNLLAWGAFQNGLGEPQLFELSTGEQARFIDQDLRIRTE